MSAILGTKKRGVYSHVYSKVWEHCKQGNQVYLVRSTRAAGGRRGGLPAQSCPRGQERAEAGSKAG